jgi:hypothetical protein
MGFSLSAEDFISRGQCSATHPHAHDDLPALGQTVSCQFVHDFQKPQDLKQWSESFGFGYDRKDFAASCQRKHGFFPSHPSAPNMQFSFAF